MPLVGFTQAEITAQEKGPSLPDPVVTSSVVGASEATGNRPAISVTILFPVPEDNEVDVRKSRSIYGLGKGVELALKDSEGNRLQFSGQLFASTKADDSADAAAKKDAPDVTDEP